MKATAKTGYLNHVAGSRKGDVHKTFNQKGPKVAMAYGRRRGLKENSLRSWFSTWNQEKARLIKTTAKKPTTKTKPTNKKTTTVRKAA
jgi:hypothetical protein